MATLTPVIVPGKALKDGKHKIRIAVAHNGQTRYIITSITLDSIKEFRNGTIIKRPDASYLNTKIRNLMQQYQETVDSTPYVNGLSCSELVSVLKNGTTTKCLSIQDVFSIFMDWNTASESTKISYHTFWRMLARILDTSKLMVHVSQSTVLELSKGLKSKKNGTQGQVLNLFRSVINFAVNHGYAEFKIHPFAGTSIPKQEIRDSWLTVEEIRKIRDAKLDKKAQQMARDLFMLSYYLGGINYADLMLINFNENKTVLKYERQKTKRINKTIKYVEFTIPDQAKVIINKYKDDKGFLPLKSPHHLSSKFRYNFPKVAEIAGIKKFIYYSARKSFSQHALELGIGEKVIDYILGHSLSHGGSCLYHYIYVTPQMATEALNKVLDNLK